MNAAGQLAVREDAALNVLKGKLTAAGASSSYLIANQQPAVDMFLLRFLRNKKLNIDEAIEKLRRRREFERSLPALTVSPGFVRALRSGALSVIGVDMLRRPVLYIRWSLLRAAADPEELEKLAIVLLEYMQHLAMSCPSQEFVLLVGQQEATWFSSQGSLQSDLFVTLMAKYYPDLVGLVLIVDAPWATRQRVKSALAAAASSRARNMLQIVSKAELNRYMDPSILPEDLGGRHAAESPLDFSETVMRYWYSVIAALAHEAATNAPRPLFCPTMVAIAAFHAGGNSAGVTSPLGGRGPVSATSSANNRAIQGRSTSGLTPRRRGGSLSASTTNPVDATTDDGCCSVISDTDVEFDRDANDDAFDRDAGVSATAGAEGTTSSANNNKLGLSLELKAERDRRVALEHELNRLRLGITIDSASVTKLEAALRQVHEEINVLVGEVISRSKASGGSAGRSALRPGQQTGPSLHQLFEFTDALVLKVIQERQPTGAMKFATPPADRSSGRGCCSVM